MAHDVSDQVDLSRAVGQHGRMPSAQAVQAWRKLWNETRHLAAAGELTADRVREHARAESDLFGSSAQLEPIIQLGLTEGAIEAADIGSILR